MSAQSMWREVRLGNVMDIQLGKMLSPVAKVGTTPKPYLRNANVQWGRFDLADVALMDFNDREQAKFRLRRGDLLVCEGGEPGRSAVWGDEVPEVYYQKALHRLRPNADGVDPHFMMYRLWLGAQSGEFGGSQAKTTIAHLPAVRLHGLRIALPPLAEQRRIAARLAEQLAAVERARGAAQEMVTAAATLRAEQVRSALATGESGEWPRRRLGEICHIQLGKMLSPKSKTGSEPRKYLRNANVQWDRFQLVDVAEMDFTEGETEKFELQRGDLLVCEGGEPGRSAVWQAEIEPCFYQKALHRLRPRVEGVNPRFLMYRMWLGAASGEFSGSHAKTTIAHLPAVRLAELEIGLPSIETQSAMVRALDEVAEVCRRLESQALSELAAISALPAALLREAFNSAG